MHGKVVKGLLLWVVWVVVRWLDMIWVLKLTRSICDEDGDEDEEGGLLGNEFV